MKKHVLAATVALGLAVGSGPALAQEISGLYFTPKILYSYQKGDLGNGRWHFGNVSGSASLGGEDTDKSFGGGLSVGYNLGYLNDIPIRVEAEYLRRGKAEFGKGSKGFSHGGNSYASRQEFEISAHTLLGNVFFDIPTDSNLTPYFGGGLGLAYLSTDYTASISNNAGLSGRVKKSNNDWNFAWNVGGGVALTLSETMALDLGYRYVDLGKADAGGITINNFKGDSSVDYTAHELSMGLRISMF